jgi:molecular chaperone GrpE
VAEEGLAPAGQAHDRDDRDGQDADGAPEEAAAEERVRAKEAADLEARLRRALADLDNLRKRYERELARERAAARAQAAAEWLPVVDNLDRALLHADADPAGVVEGVRAVRDQAVAVLARLGFPRFDEEVGRPFDPVRHEAVGVVADPDVKPGTVLEVVRPGYGTDEAILRPAGVIVASGAQ